MKKPLREVILSQRYAHSFRASKSSKSDAEVNAGSLFDIIAPLVTIGFATIFVVFSFAGVAIFQFWGVQFSQVVSFEDVLNFGFEVTIKTIAAVLAAVMVAVVILLRRNRRLSLRVVQNEKVTDVGWWSVFGIIRPIFAVFMAISTFVVLSPYFRLKDEGFLPRRTFLLEPVIHDCPSARVMWSGSRAIIVRCGALQRFHVIYGPENAVLRIDDQVQLFPRPNAVTKIPVD